MRDAEGTIPPPDGKRVIRARDDAKAVERHEGTYLWTTADEGEALYVGSTDDIRNRAKMHVGPKAAIAAELRERGELALLIWRLGEPARWELEVLIWERLRPKHNKQRPYRISKHKTQRKRGSLQRVPTPEELQAILERMARSD